MIKPIIAIIIALNINKILNGNNINRIINVNITPTIVEKEPNILNIAKIIIFNNPLKNKNKIKHNKIIIVKPSIF